MLTHLPTMSTDNYESDPNRIIRKRLLEYITVYKLDSDFARGGMFSLEEDLARHAGDNLETADRIRGSIYALLKDYFNDLEISVRIDSGDGRINNINTSITGIGSDSSKYDAVNIFRIDESDNISLLD